MRFREVGVRPTRIAPGTAWLVRLGIPDYEFDTAFELIVDTPEQRYEFGTVKIGHLDHLSGQIGLPIEFTQLDPGYFSVGQDEEYYLTAHLLEPEAKQELLTGLRDIATNPGHRSTVNRCPSYRQSVTRYVSRSQMRRFERASEGVQRTTGYGFGYQFPGSNGPHLEFTVRENSRPSSNVHVIIGRNGVGKTRLLNNMVRLLAAGSAIVVGPELGTIVGPSLRRSDGTFTSVVSVSFSAFDDFLPPSQLGEDASLRYRYIGLRHIQTGPDAEGTPRLKSPSDQVDDFISSARRCHGSSLRPLWLECIGVLSTDPGFAALQLETLADASAEEFDQRAGDIFSASSSGHKIVLLTIAQLVASVSDRCLVLIDEPEAHLHPPLMASYVRALSGILTQQNGLAVVATHSPVFLQEVRRDCAWILDRRGDAVAAFRPTIETFAENVGVLTREVFQLEVTQSGHHALIVEVCEEADSFSEVLEEFEDALGSEGKAIALAEMVEGA